MSKILIEGNKIIIDGHANDLETCNTLTNLCDELSTSDKFRTVKYESGYGEFESVSECGEKKKFPVSVKLDIIIYSNDGTTKLFETRKIPNVNIEVQSTGLLFNDGSETNYTYAGGKIFLGLSNKVNSTSATFPVGYSGTLSTMGMSSNPVFYIVEADPGYQVNIQSNDGTAILAQNATVDSVVVTSTGAQLKNGSTVNATYTYSGSKLFAGLATSANATAPKYKPGDTIEITAETTLYIVENIIIPEHHSSLTELFTNIAEVIREKTGDTELIVADDFPDVIRERLQMGPPLPYLTFKSPSRFTLKVNDAVKHWNGTLEYSTDKFTWSTWNGNTLLSSATMGGKNVLYLRGTGNTVITGDSPNYRWVLTGSDISCIGNIENLLDYATVESGEHPTMGYYCYAHMFRGCTSLTHAPSLPATTLARSCYNNMFSGCTSLIQAPALPATTLADYCYQEMFYGCTSLIQAPAALPATTLVNRCYANMFSGCTSLTKAPDLSATTLAVYCCQQMFQNCTSLIQAPSLPATTLANTCYANMFQNCTSLIQAPSLPATTLANACYYSMFQGCTSLIQAPSLPATTLADYCYYSMFQGCTKIKVSSTQTGEYTVAYRIPTTGTGTTTTDALTDMFTSTGGTFTGTPEINTTYYLSNTNTVIYPPVTLISFTIDGVSYQAEEGMTWEEWINSDYDTPGAWHVSREDMVIGNTRIDTNQCYVGYSDLRAVKPSDVIQAKYAYSLGSFGGN